MLWNHRQSEGARRDRPAEKGRPTRTGAPHDEPAVGPRPVPPCAAAHKIGLFGALGEPSRSRTHLPVDRMGGRGRPSRGRPLQAAPSENCRGFSQCSGLWKAGALLRPLRGPEPTQSRAGLTSLTASGGATPHCRTPPSRGALGRFPCSRSCPCFDFGAKPEASTIGTTVDHRPRHVRIPV
jgi:hypothetical protein